MNDSEQQLNHNGGPEVKLEDAERLVLPNVDKYLLENPEASIDLNRQKPMIETAERSPEAKTSFHTKIQTDDDQADADESEEDQPKTPVEQAVSVVKKAPIVAVKPVEEMTDKEKEDFFVDKAKNIVHQTQNNPHRREEEIKDLREDYVFTRYGVDTKKDKKG